MSFKSIDMQFALHKNIDAGLKQQQLQQKPVEDQALLGQTGERKLEMERQRSAQVDESAESGIREFSAHTGEGYGSGRQGKKETDGGKQGKHNQSSPEHPYKGHHIDLSF